MVSLPMHEVTISVATYYLLKWSGLGLEFTESVLSISSSIAGYVPSSIEARMANLNHLHNQSAIIDTIVYKETILTAQIYKYA